MSNIFNLTSQSETDTLKPHSMSGKLTFFKNINLLTVLCCAGVRSYSTRGWAELQMWDICRDEASSCRRTFLLARTVAVTPSAQRPRDAASVSLGSLHGSDVMIKEKKEAVMIPMGTVTTQQGLDSDGVNMKKSLRSFTLIELQTHYDGTNKTKRLWTFWCNFVYSVSCAVVT